MLGMSIAIPFPSVQPADYEWFDDEPEFDPARHLALEAPTEIVMLSDLGYDNAEIATKATPVACSSPFRVLSDEGAEVMLALARRLLDFAKPAGNRIERMTRGGCYRSRWLRDLCISPDVSDHMASIYGVDVAPHAMPLHLGHINYQPTTLGAAVDKWHHDTLPLDFVMTVTDPATLDGGHFEWFRGTKHEMVEMRARGEAMPRERVVAPAFPGPGYAIALHGNMIVHRGAPLNALGERISMVNGYVAMDSSADEQSRSRDLIVVDDHEVLYAEWAKFAAWRAQSRLGTLIDNLPFGADPDRVIVELEESIVDVERAIADMRAGEVPIHHYE